MAELRRLVAATLPLAWIAASPAAAAELEWRVLPRSSVNAAHRVVVDLPGEVCRKRQPGEWRIDGRPRAIRFRQDADAPSRCHASLELRDDGNYEVALRGHEKTTIAIEDRLVVAFGDALGTRGPRCGAGGPSGYEEALALLAAGSPHAALTYARRGCSTAGKTAALERQAQRLARLNRRHGVDAVVLRLGGRHVRAGAVMRRCGKPNDCLDAAAPGGGDGTLGELVDTRLATLPRKLDGLAETLESAGVPAAKVLVVPFVDPTLSPGGARCDTDLAQLSREELRWIGEVLIGSLNLELGAAAERHGWRIAAGLPRAFVRNGPCAAKGERWIRIVDGALLPNTAGRLVVAGKLAPSLATVLALAPVEHEDRTDWQKFRDWVEAKWGQFWRWFGRQPFAAQFVLVAITLLGFVGLFALAFGPTLRRTSFIVRPAGRPSPGRARENPTRPHIEIPRTWLEFAVRMLAGAVGVLASAAFVTVVGAAILWCRFRAARIPADEAVAVVPESQFVVVGAQALILFAILALFAVLLVWIVDGKGGQVRATRRGLLVLLLAELVITIVIEDFPLRQALWLFAGLALLAWLLHFLFERTLMPGSIVRISALPTELWSRSRWFFRLDADAHGSVVVSVLVDAAGIVVGVVLLVLGTYLTGWVLDGANRLWGVGMAVAGATLLLTLYRYGTIAALRVIGRSLPLATLVGALYLATWADALDRWLLVPTIMLAAVLFVAPWAIGGKADDGPGHPNLELPRLALACTTIACIMILVWRDERWLALAGVVAILLAGACLVVAHSSGDDFLPYGAAVLVSIPLFGAAVAILQAWESPQMQPIATISKDLKRSSCGLFVAETDEHMYLARVDLDELGGVRRPRPRRSRLAWVRREDLAATSVGPLQPLGPAVDQALTLRRGLLRAFDVKNPDRKAGSSCEAIEPAPRIHRSKGRKLARRFQPEVVLDRHDRFWPVPVRTVFAMQDRHGRVCRRIDDRDAGVCVRVNTQADLPWIGGESESLELPAGNDVANQYKALVDALGSIDPQRSAMEYFLVSGGDARHEPISLQYWFFYTYNRQRLPGGTTAGRHEGDFESVGVLLSRETKRPRYVWMARHDDEGRVFTWNEPVLERTGDHVRVFSALGSHASYENCLRQARRQAPGGLIDDRPTCEAERQLKLPPESTPLTDLARVPWGCWQGRWGHRPGDRAYERLPYVEGNGPLSPLWQQEFDHVPAKPCEGLRVPATREGPGEEVLAAAHARKIRRDAGRLEVLIDECSDWESAPAVGTYLVACDPVALRRYVNSGLEDPGRAGVHIDDGAPAAPQMGALDVPAVRRAQSGVDFDTWRIASVRRTRVDVYASCVAGDTLLEARFRSVPLDPDRPLRLDDSLGRVWRLREPAGATVQDASPRVVKGERDKKRRRCGT